MTICYSLYIRFIFVRTLWLDSGIVQCMLCGVCLSSRLKSQAHISYNHSRYGLGRHCSTCKQYFPSVRSTRKHIDGGYCPGSPCYYCSSTGRLYYRGMSRGYFASADMFPRLRNNQLMCNPPYERFLVAVNEEMPRADRVDVLKPYGDVSPSDYKVRNYAPSFPRVLENTSAVIGDDEPCNREELDKLCGTHRTIRRPPLVKTNDKTNDRKKRDQLNLSGNHKQVAPYDHGEGPSTVITYTQPGGNSLNHASTGVSRNIVDHPHGHKGPIRLQDVAVPFVGMYILLVSR